MNRPIGLLLDDDCSRPNVATRNDIANLDLDQVAATQLAVDCKVEECLVPQPPFSIEMEADRPNLLLGKWAVLT